jgi:hypothetical protein
LENESFTYYTVDKKVKITNVRVEQYTFTHVCGNVTNISDELIRYLFVHAIVREQEGYVDKNYCYYFDEIPDLYPNQTKKFSINVINLDDGRTFETLLIY